jgi:hypothetical protein
MRDNTFQDKAPIRWARTVERMSATARRAVIDRAGWEAIRCARVSAYVSTRDAGGSHAAGVKAQNTAARQVRRALGFAYPSDPITF